MNLHNLNKFILSTILLSVIALLTVSCSQNSDCLSSVKEDRLEQTASTFSYVEQYGWKYCKKCKSLFWGPSEVLSSCYAGGTHESLPNSYEYALHYDCQNAPSSIQIGWKYCVNCKTLFWGGCESTSSCPAGGTHNSTGSSTYGLLFQNDGTFSPVQSNWKYCSKCKSLDYAGASGVCYDGYDHDNGASSTYYLKYR
jgi:hypothetical protein